MDVDSDFEYSENLPAKKVGGKAKVVKRKPDDDSAVLQPINASNKGSQASNKGSQAIEEIYQKKTQLEHILLRPDTYIGSTEKQQQKLWIHDGTCLKLAEIDYVPGLYKIFDEILVNAADNKVRDSSMDMLKVDIDKENNTITVWNNGDGVPVEMHKDEQVYVPELIFGHLLTSSNYNDSEKKVTGGRNGYGAKLANIFSTEFVIETCDGNRQKRFRQVFTNNMASKSQPSIKACKASDNWTCVTFKPDLSKFGMEELEDDTIALMRKRVYDLAGVLGKGVKVLLNGDRLPIKNFMEYVEMYLPDKSVPRIHEKINDRWEIVVTAAPGQFQQVSFVNSICTTKGGTHVNYLTDQITKGLVEMMGKSKEHKKANVKAFMVKNYLSIFVNCMIENPAFDSQTKETLTLRASSFGSKCEISDKLLKKLGNDCGIIELVASFASFKNNKELKKGDGAKRSRIPGMTKLMDANDAGGRNSSECTLILTEGDSAKSTVVGGLSVAGRDKFGVFPLRGKLLNVRDASTTQITGNAEINNIKQIMGLQHGKQYDSVKQLRYGHLMIMTDQDHDGSHIKGLIMNFFHTFYPSLLQLPGFLLEFITPIVKATKGSQSKSFYSMPEYESWCESVNTSGWKIKYYKGLGTSTDEEAMEYFGDIDRYRKSFVWTGEQDAQKLELAFSKKRVEERKAWLQGFQMGTFLDQTADEISYADFVDKELILFSRADLERSIPSMVDGLKPGQRKIMFCCFKKGLKNDIKVAQLSGYVSEHAAYHHGETSLQSTIVGLAQSFVGSNNINLLVPSGQFGTRLQGGKDAASARYIFTRMEKITRTIFHEADDKLLDYLNEEGQNIEPHWYMPVIPMVLVNGAEGIGTGWSTFIPNFNPRDIVANIRRLLVGELLVPMQPWYKNFKGAIQEIPTKTAGKSYACNGIVTKEEGNVINITELPIRKWTQDYKEYLESLIKPEDKSQKALLVDYKEHHTGANVHFELQTSENAVTASDESQLLAAFKLTTKISLGNMVLFNKDGIIQRYSTPEEILVDFYQLRLEYYHKRRQYLIQAAEFELMKLSNKVRFILAVISGELKVSNRKRADIVDDLDTMEFDRIAPAKKAKVLAAAAAAVEDMDEEQTGPSEANFDYLLSMPIHSLTLEKVEALQNEEERQRDIVATTKATTPEKLYNDDLDAFIEALEDYEQREQALLAGLKAKQKKAGGMAKARQAVKAKKKKAQGSESDDNGDFSDEDFAPVKKSKAPSRTASTKPAASASTSNATSQTVSMESKPAVKRLAKGLKTIKEESSVPKPEPEPKKETSLMDRLTGRLNRLSVEPSEMKAVASEPAKPTAKTAKAPAPRKKKVVDSDSEDSISEPESSGSEVEVVSKKKAPAKAAPANKPAAKRKPPAVSNIIQESQAEAASPVVAPKGKVRRMRPSPFHKGSGPKFQAPSRPVPPPRPMAPSKISLDSDSDEVQEVEASQSMAANRPQRRAAATKKPAYVEILSSDASEPEDTGSEFEASD